jgi:hypothetical protein
MKRSLLLVPVLLAAFKAAPALASELHYLPGGQPACYSEEEEGCAIGRKTAAETAPASAQSDCFNHEIAAVRSSTKVPAGDAAVMIVAGLCREPSAAITACVNAALAGARDAGNPVSTDAGLSAIVRMCSAPK